MEYLSVVEVAEASDLLILVEDVAVDLHLAHDFQLAQVLQEVIAGHFGGEGDGVLGQLPVGRLLLSGCAVTSSRVASDTVAKEGRLRWSNLIMMMRYLYLDNISKYSD